jgi:hypothetical protein
MSGYSEKSRVPVFDTFVEVEGISDYIGSELDTNMPADSTVVFTGEEEFKNAVKAKRSR